MLIGNRNTDHTRHFIANEIPMGKTVIHERERFSSISAPFLTTRNARIMKRLYFFIIRKIKPLNVRSKYSCE